MTTDSRQQPLTLSTRHTCHRKRDQEAKAFSMSSQSYFTHIFMPTAVKTFFLLGLGFIKGHLIDDI